MKKINYIILLGVLFLLLQNCCNNKNESKSIHNNLKMSDNKSLGEWYSVDNRCPFEAVLTIDSNYNFTYAGGGCVWRLHSKGRWIINEDTLILNSADPEECYYIGNFSDFGKIITLDDTLKVVTSIAGCTPKLPDEYIIFDNEKFIIKDSALIYTQNPIEVRTNFTRRKLTM